MELNHLAKVNSAEQRRGSIQLSMVDMPAINTCVLEEGTTSRAIPMPAIT